MQSTGRQVLERDKTLGIISFQTSRIRYKYYFIFSFIH